MQVTTDLHLLFKKSSSSEIGHTRRTFLSSESKEEEEDNEGQGNNLDHFKVYLQNKNY